MKILIVKELFLHSLAYYIRINWNKKSTFDPEHTFGGTAQQIEIIHMFLEKFSQVQS